MDAVRRSYTVGEANRTLPYVASIVREIRERYAEIRERGRIHNDMPEMAEEMRAELKRGIQADAERIHSCMEELDAISIELTDYEMGLVDFPAEHEGRSIVLCWKFGEESIGFWHEVRDGYAGRQPIPAGEPDWPRAVLVDG